MLWRPLCSDAEEVHGHLQKFAQPLWLDPEFVSLVLVAEDKRFWNHPGVDVLALGRAFFWFLLRRPKGGGSTIEMQYVRTVTGRYERTLSRKLRETVLAAALSRSGGKAEILSAYLRCAYFGHHIEGADAASDALFGRPVHECSYARKALLAALLVWPIPSSRSTAWYRKSFARARWITARHQQDR